MSCLVAFVYASDLFLLASYIVNTFVVIAKLFVIEAIKPVDKSWREY